MNKLIYVTNNILIILKTTTSTSHDDIAFLASLRHAWQQIPKENRLRKQFSSVICDDEACSVTTHRKLTTTMMILK